MSAIADQELEVRALAQSLRRFARALTGAAPGSGCDVAPGAIEEALRAARRAPDPLSAQIEGYRRLIQRFAMQAGPAATTPAARPSIDAVLALQRTSLDATRKWRALSGLEPAHRAALLLVVVERLPYARAAEALDMAEADFIKALARAREALAGRLAAISACGRRHLKLVS